VEGTPAQPPFLLVSNHLSYVDVFALAAVAAPVFIAKAEVRSWWLIGLLARHMEVIFIDREDLKDVVRVKELVFGAIQRGHGVHIFAEGGISQTCQVAPFKPALLDVAARNNYPVHHVTITYKTPQNSPPPSKVVAWIGGKPFMAHLVRLAGSCGFEVSLTFGEAPVVCRDRKALAEQLTQAVRARFVPIE